MHAAAHVACAPVRVPAALVGAQLISLIAWFALTRAGLLALNVAEPKTGQISKYPC